MRIAAAQGSADIFPRLMNLQAGKRAAVVLSCDDVKFGRSNLDEWSLAALSLALPVCFLSADPQRVVPQRARTVADHVLRFGRWTGSALAVAIEAVTGSPVDVPQESWIAGVSIDDLKASVSRRRGGPGSLERLKWIVEKRRALSQDLPRLENLSGYGNAHRIGLDLIADLKACGRGEIGWRDIDRGMLLAGPPGVGKSFFARVFTDSAGLPVVSVSLAQWQASGHLGDLLKAMKRSFAEARAAAPCVLFIDELDSIGDRAGFDHRHRDYSTQVVNGLLEQLDGSSDREGVVVLGATNHVHNIDPAVVRPGRFDRVVRIGLPDPRELAGILRTCLGSDLQAADLMPIARAGSGASGADAAAWVRQTRGSARRAGRELRVEDLMEAARKDRTELLPIRRRRGSGGVRTWSRRERGVCGRLRASCGVSSGSTDRKRGRTGRNRGRSRRGWVSRARRRRMGRRTAAEAISAHVRKGVRKCDGPGRNGGRRDAGRVRSDPWRPEHRPEPIQIDAQP